MTGNSFSTEPGTAVAPRTVRFERLLPGPAERIWAYLTESDKRRKWLAAGEMDLKAGGRADLVFRHAEFTDETPPEKYAEMNAKGFPSVHRIVEVDPPRLLVMTWPGDGEHESEVTFELFSEGGNVRLVVTHERLAGRGEMANVASGWHAHLGVLEDVLSGAGPVRFWADLARLEPWYARRFAD